MNNHYWIQVPVPGKSWGEGKWERLKDTEFSAEYWEECYRTNEMPTHIGSKPPRVNPQEITSILAIVVVFLLFGMLFAYLTHNNQLFVYLMFAAGAGIAAIAWRVS